MQSWMKGQSWWVKGGLFVTGIWLYEFRFARTLLPEILRTPGKENWVWYVTGLGSALLIASAMGSRRLQRLLHIRPLIFLGRISYSFYLLHFGLLLCFTPFFLETINRWGVRSVASAYWLGWAATAASALALSELSFRWIERPSIEMGRKIASRLTFGCNKRPD